MGPLQPNKDDMLQELAGYAPAGSSAVPGSTSSSGEKSGAGAAAVVGILGNVLSTFISNRLTQQRAEWQNQQNIAQWQRENAYNTPVAQMARLAAAGINPALAYSNGDIMNEAASSPQLTSGQVMSPVQFDPLTAAQVRNLDSQSRLNDSNIPVNEQRAEELKQSARNLETEGNYLLATYAQRVASALATGKLEEGDALERYNRLVDFIQSEYDQKRAEADKAIQGHANLKKEYDILVERYNAAVAEAKIKQADVKKHEFFSNLYDKANALLNFSQSLLEFFNKIGVGSSPQKSLPHKLRWDPELRGYYYE